MLLHLQEEERKRQEEMRAAAKEEADRHAKEQNPLYHLIGPGNLVRDTFNIQHTK